MMQQRKVTSSLDRCKELTSQYAQVDFSQFKIATILDVGRSIAVLVHSTEKMSGFLANIVNLQQVDSFCRWLYNCNVPASGATVYLVGGNDIPSSMSSEQLSKWNISSRSSQDIVAGLKAKLSNLGYSIQSEDLFGDFRRDVSLTADGRVVITTRKIFSPQTYELASCTFNN